MIYGYEDTITIFLAIIGFIITLFAQLKINMNYHKYKNIANKNKMTGREVARLILDNNQLNNVDVLSVEGELTDHYDPTTKVVRLSNDIYHGNTIAALSVAAHECGHAIQDKENYRYMIIRSKLVPVVNFISYAGYFTILISLIAGATGYFMLGVITLLATLLFQIVTLPVEFDASNRALNQLEKLKIITEEEKESSKKMLASAAFTYVASVISNILDLIRIIIMLLNSRKDD